jgi:dihydroorotate dehydrogenase
MYRIFFTVIFRRVSPEVAHAVGFGLIRLAGSLPGVAGLLRRWLFPHDPALRVRTLGLDFAGPLGLAAGFDKDAEGPEALGMLGFACVEVGTLTAVAQPGNPRPRMFRLVQDRALINRMGFNNSGSAAAADRLRRRAHRPVTQRNTPGVVVGVNIGKTKVVPEGEAAADYVTSARLLADVSDYLVVNVSSPNTPGLRNLQAVEHLRPLLGQVRAALDAAGPRHVPLLVKIAPDLADDDVDAVADLALELGLDGIVATNTTITRDGLRTGPEAVTAMGAGGLSGAPLRNRSLEVLRRLHTRVGDRLVLVAAGGIETPEDAWERILAGASLVQAYTAFIYNGPFWPRRMHRGLARLAREAGFASVQDAVGTGAT